MTLTVNIVTALCQAHERGAVVVDSGIYSIEMPEGSFSVEQVREAFTAHHLIVDALQRIASVAPGEGDVCELIAKIARTALATVSK